MNLHDSRGRAQQAQPDGIFRTLIANLIKPNCIQRYFLLDIYWWVTESTCLALHKSTGHILIPSQLKLGTKKPAKKATRFLFAVKMLVCAPLNFDVPRRSWAPNSDDWIVNVSPPHDHS
jgi:hypothetical protein